MKSLIFFLGSVLGICSAAYAQVAIPNSSYFPAITELPEPSKVISETDLKSPSDLSKMEHGRIMAAVGFQDYSRRQYLIGNSGSLAIEITALIDFRAAYSLLTLLRGSDLQNGPPGDAFTATAGDMKFAQGKYWVQIQGKNVSDDLIKRLALSISRRIGPSLPKPPSLVSHFPKLGYDASSLKYFPSLEVFRAYTGSVAADALKISSDAEIAQARYTVNNQPGLMYLLKFPTIQVAEDYYADLPLLKISLQEPGETYVKRAGPIVAVFKGPFAPVFADKILSSLHYGYSVQWLFEKRNNTKIIWGIPVGILGTVVNSLFFVSLLCVVSIILGIVFAISRFWFRNRLYEKEPDRPERPDITRLRLR